MKQEDLNNWEGEQNESVKQTSFTDVALSSSCDAWGSRIEATLLADLAEEEWRCLAEHAKTCSACAERFQKYQFIEEIARKLPQQNLYDQEYEQVKHRLAKGYHMAIPKVRLESRRKEVRKISLAICASLIWLVSIAAWLVTGELRLLAVVGMGSAAAVTSVLMRSRR